MRSSITRRHRLTAWLTALILVALAGVALASNSDPKSASGDAETSAIVNHPAPRHANASQVFTSCTPVQVMAFPERIHVRCAAAVGGVRFFALGTSNARHAARILSILTTAQVAGRDLTILFDPGNLSGTSIGCLASDCRLIIAAGFGR